VEETNKRNALIDMSPTRRNRHGALAYSAVDGQG